MNQSDSRGSAGHSADLRTRIAAVLDGHVAGWYYDCCPEGEKHVGEWSQHVADVLIRELGLRLDTTCHIHDRQGKQRCHRYVTEWTADE